MKSIIREQQDLLKTSTGLKTSADGVRIEESDVIGIEACIAIHDPIKGKTESKTQFKITLNPDSVKSNEVLEPCGQCVECWSNGMPHFCDARVLVTAFYYKEIKQDSRIYGDEENRFYVIKET